MITGVPPHLVLANSVAKLQREMVCMKEDIIDKLEHLPEALKQSMLENFQIEGTVPITRHEMQEMMRLSIDDLKNSIENSLNSIASRTIPSALIANTPIAGHAYFFIILLFLYFTVWSSVLYCCTVLFVLHLILLFYFILFRINRFFLPLCTSCTTRNLWDLWWFGNPIRNMAPYRTHTPMDYVPKKFLSYLSRARKVMEKIESLLEEKYENLNLSRMNITDSRMKFAIGFDALCVWLSPELSIIELDLRHYGDAMYVSFYERLLKKRKRDASQNPSVV
jgi:hypothetical protein